MKVISIQSKTVNGQEYNVIKGYSDESISERQYRDEVESYGSELVHFAKKGNIYDVIVTV